MCDSGHMMGFALLWGVIAWDEVSEGRTGCEKIEEVRRELVCHDVI